MAPRRPVSVLAVAVAAVLAAGPARADRIDGEWCAADGRHISIDGPAIVTPGGNSLSGAYDRHGFAYTVPEGESGAGASVIMAQQNEGTIHVATDPSPGQGAGPALEVWHRCPPPTS